MHSRPPTVSRRRMLLGAAGLAAFGVASAACGSSPPSPEVDEMADQLNRARTDGKLAADAAAVPGAPFAQALTTVASERAAHAQALSDELARMAGKLAPTTTPLSSSVAAPAKAPTVADVIAALRSSADSATQLAASMSGYRAGLLGSIAASCTAACTVALVPPGEMQ